MSVESVWEKRESVCDEESVCVCEEREDSVCWNRESVCEREREREGVVRETRVCV